MSCCSRPLPPLLRGQLPPSCFSSPDTMYRRFLLFRQAHNWVKRGHCVYGTSSFTCRQFQATGLRYIYTGCLHYRLIFILTADTLVVNVSPVDDSCFHSTDTCLLTHTYCCTVQVNHINWQTLAINHQKHEGNQGRGRACSVTRAYDDNQLFTIIHICVESVNCKQH